MRNRMMMMMMMISSIPFFLCIISLTSTDEPSVGWVCSLYLRQLGSWK